VRDAAEARERSLVVVTAGLRDPSATSLLADRMAAATFEALRERGVTVAVQVVDLRTQANDLTSMLLTGVASPALRSAIDAVASADGLIAVTPIFSGSYNGLFKTFFDVLGEEALVGAPVLLGATAGTARHSLAIDHALRPLFAYLRAVTVPSGVFASTDDFGHSDGVRSDDEGIPPLADRVKRGAAELADLMVNSPSRPPADPFALTKDFEDLLRDG
jgi:FMN reductase